MKVELEYLHDSDSGKVWIAELKDKTILVKFGKKGCNLQEKSISFKNKDEANDEFNKRLNEKLNKGYEYVDIGKEKPEKKVSKKAKDNIVTKQVAKNEALTDTYQDITNYGIIAQLVERGLWKK
jgi:predicted DNA-binding WGR domain protein